MADSPFDDPKATPFEDATKAPTVRSVGSESEPDTTSPMQQKIEDFAKGPLAKEAASHHKRDQDIIAQSDRTYKDDIGEARHAYEQIKPAHFDPPPTPQSLFQNWGAAFLPLVMLAARKGSRPRIDTLTAAAGFMKGAAEGNQQQFERDFATWREKSKQVIEEQRALQDKYQNALKLAQTDQQAGQFALKREAILHEDNLTKMFAEHGMNDDLAKYHQSMQRAADAEEMHREKILDWKRKQELKLQDIKEHPNRSAQETAAALGAIDRMDKAPQRTPVSQKIIDHISSDDPALQEMGRRELEAVHKVSQARTEGRNQLDLAVRTRIEKYPGVTPESVGYINKQGQTRIQNAFDSADAIEDVAAFIKANPRSIGVLADASNKINLRAYLDLFKDRGDAWQEASKLVEADRNNYIDEVVKAKGFDVNQGDQAKILNKKLVTLAFADAAASGQRGGGTIYLDKAFREIYDQRQGPAVIMGTLQAREQDSNRILEKDYKLGLPRQTDFAKDYPFMANGLAGGPAGSQKSVPVPKAFMGKPDGTQLEKDGVTWTKQGDQLISQ